ncbi:hypothetical protein [Tenacibaculum aiptasiae]|uniref:hypothetical protein n=1 Tax=Tenacibaculum aiptasiae TaxID=426481 RepID=UPI00232BFF87|nr:hypothetical protein [Tenacibaculum aiptasiae]
MWTILFEKKKNNELIEKGFHTSFSSNIYHALQDFYSTIELDEIDEVKLKIKITPLKL